MKKALIPALACAIVLAACTGQKKMEPVSIGLKSGDSNPPLSSITVYGSDSLIICQNGKNFTYTVDKNRCLEKIDDKRHIWTFGITRKDPSAPDYKSVNIPRFREDIYGKAPKEASWQDDCTIEDSRHYTYRSKITDSVALSIGLLSAETMFPEVKIKVGKFNKYSSADLSKIPQFVKTADTLTLKGNTFTISYDGGKTETLNIIPYTDSEEAHSEHCYTWSFSATKDTSRYYISITTGMSMPNGKLTVKPCEYINYDIRGHNNDFGYYESEEPLKNCENLKPRLCRVYSSYQDCKDVDDYYPYDGEEGDYGEEEEAPKPPTPPNIEKIKKYLAENVPGLDKGEFNDESHRELLHTAQPDQNGNCAETLVHWYPEDPKGNKWTIYVIGRNAVASNKFMTFTYTSSGITPSTKEKELNRYDDLGNVSMYDNCIEIDYYIDNDRHQDDIYFDLY